MGKAKPGGAGAVFNAIMTSASAKAPGKADQVTRVSLTFTGPLGSAIALEEVVKFLNTPVRVTLEELQGSLELT